MQYPEGPKRSGGFCVLQAYSMLFIITLLEAYCYHHVATRMIYYTCHPSLTVVLGVGPSKSNWASSINNHAVMNSFIQNMILSLYTVDLIWNTLALLPVGASSLYFYSSSCIHVMDSEHFLLKCSRRILCENSIFGKDLINIYRVLSLPDSKCSNYQLLWPNINDLLRAYQSGC